MASPNYAHKYIFGRIGKMSLSNAYLLAGGNLGQRAANLQTVRETLEALAGRIAAASPVYETAAWGMDGPAFLNQALHLQTALSAQELLALALEIEQRMGRLREQGAGYQNRSMDIDILLFDNAVISSEALTVPHPRMAERRFVLQPLADIAAELVHPVTGQSIAEMLRTCPDSLQVQPYNITATHEA